MRALVVYESMFGNTQTIAHAIAEGLWSSMRVDTVEVGSAPTTFDGIDLLVVGGPTHQFGISRASSRAQAAEQAPDGLVSSGIGLREWMDDIHRLSDGIASAAFDTTLEKPRILRIFGRASRKVTKLLRRRGARIVMSPESFWVAGGNGPLADGEVERARKWGEEIASMITAPGAAERLPA
jgi:hypothetical protein